MKKIIILAIVVFALSFAITPALAQDSFFTIVPQGCIDNPPAGTSHTDQCNLNQVYEMIVNVSRIILTLTGSAALLMFTYGGLMFIIAAGEQERIKKAKEILKNAVIGIVIILGGWMIVNTTILALSQGQVGGKSAIFGRTLGENPGTGTGLKTGPTDSKSGCLQNCTDKGFSPNECNEACS